MPFDAAKFDAAQFTPRTEAVDVPALAAFFAEGEPAQWHVRGLTASELHNALEAKQRQSSVEAVVKAIASSGDQVQAVRKALGLTADTPGEVAKRLEMLVMGSTAPKIELATAVKLAEHFPIEFMLITNKITELTGMGADLVKPAAASQPTPA